VAPAWYAEAFDDLHRRLYAHRDEAEAERAIAWLAARVDLAGRCVADVGCGDGRHLRSLARHGAQVIGVDLSMAMLARAAAVPGATARCVRADMRRLPLATASCDGAVSLFTSLGYFETEAEHAAVLAGVATAVRPGGFFMVDYLNASRVRRELVPRSTRRVGDLLVDEARRIDPRRRRVLKTITVEDASGRVVKRYHESVALWSSTDLAARLAGAGFEILDRAGDYDGRPFDAEQASRLILLARRCPAAPTRDRSA
jgi:SAM-dependent methyltransferase